MNTTYKFSITFNVRMVSFTCVTQGYILSCDVISLCPSLHSGLLSGSTDEIMCSEGMLRRELWIYNFLLAFLHFKLIHKSKVRDEKL
jgi:hypothetical protein